MGKRDFRHHELKKSKKSTKKPLVSDIIQTPLNVEVIGKKKRKKGQEEEF